MAEQWFAGKINLRATTRARYESALRIHVMSRWGDIRLDRVEHGDIQRWLAGLASDGQSGASVRKAHGVLSSVLDLAVKERRLATNPSNGVKLPALSERGRRYLTAEQVDQLASHARVGRLPVLVLAYCGLRWSELAGLRVRDVDLMRRRLNIERAVTEVNGGRLEWNSPKNHERRSVPLPRFIVFTSSAVSVPAPPVPADPVMSLLRTDPAAAWTAWNADQPDTAGSIWPDSDPYTTDASFYGSIHYG